MLVFDAPADGAYVLEVRDLQYRGGGDFAYRIDAGQIPYVESLVPSSGQRGSKVEVTAVGHNLPGRREDHAGPDHAPRPARCRCGPGRRSGYSNEAAFSVSEMTQATEQEPNNTPETANPVNLPAEISGTLDKPGDEDCFKFHVASRQTVDAGGRRPPGRLAGGRAADAQERQGRRDRNQQRPRPSASAR